MGSELVPATVTLRDRRGRWGSLFRQVHRFQVLRGRRQFRRGPAPRPRRRNARRSVLRRRISLRRLRHTLLQEVLALQSGSLLVRFLSLITNVIVIITRSFIN